MRTKTLLLTAALVAAGTATSMAQATVYSVNSVGYVNITTHNSGAYSAVSNPLNAGANDISEVYPPAVIGEDFSVLTFNAATGQFDPVVSTFDDGSGIKWVDQNFVPTTKDLPPGKGHFLQNNTFVDKVVTYTGEVPEGNGLTVSVPPNLSFAGSIVPQSLGLTPDPSNPAAPHLGFGNIAPDTIYLAWNSDAAGSGGQVFRAGKTYDLGTSPTTGWINEDFSPASIPTPGVAEGWFFSNPNPTQTWSRDFHVSP